MWQKNRYNFRDTKPAHAIKAIKMKDLVFFFGGGGGFGGRIKMKNIQT